MSFKNELEESLNEKVAKIVWENENTSISKIIETIKTKAEKSGEYVRSVDTKESYEMPQYISTLYHSEGTYLCDKYVCESESGEKVTLLYNEYASMFNLNCNNANIAFDRKKNVIQYYLKSREGKITPLGGVEQYNRSYERTIVDFPVKNDTVVDIKSNIREIIEEVISKDSEIREYVNVILNNFDSILSFDKEREIIPVPSDVVTNSLLIKEINQLKYENNELQNKYNDLEKNHKFEEMELKKEIEENKALKQKLTLILSIANDTLSELQLKIKKFRFGGKALQEIITNAKTRMSSILDDKQIEEQENLTKNEVEKESKEEVPPKPEEVKESKEEVPPKPEVVKDEFIWITEEIEELQNYVTNEYGNENDDRDDIDEQIR